MGRLDPHSYYETDQPAVSSLDLDLNVDFDTHVLDGRATLHFEREVFGPVDLDTKGLSIQSAVTGTGADVPYELADEEPILGRRLRLHLPAGTREVEIMYRTSPDATALQWLAPGQTEGKRQPFLFSQCQSIHARTVVPLQDTPRVRVPYRAAITVPEPLRAVMSAGPTGDRPGPVAGTRTFLFEMPQPIPSYLLALAVGDLAARELGPRARVWAEPETVEAAAWEFGEIETMIRKAEDLFGPYEWDRYDMLVLPPSFPYGGMENPRLTFLTPTLLAGDRSLVDVVIHELAHSWTGNLVTNATMDHFWLNEGFTVWAERRIQEEIKGADFALMGWATGQKALADAFERFGADSPVTRLRTDLRGLDPDDVYSQIPYEKGARFVVLLERAVGRDAFLGFIRDYIERFRFTSITTEEFLEFLDQRLPGVSGQVGARRWLYETGMPANAPEFRSPKLELLTALGEGWSAGQRPDSEQALNWRPDELLVYLQHLPRSIDRAGCEWLDGQFGLTRQGNYELLVEWLSISASSDYEPAFDRIREVLTRVGRMKYLRPLYRALGTHPRTRALAREIFAEARDGYHVLSRRVIESVMKDYPQS
ncbi:MAG: M1 family metallopeptidase [Acidobacteria bacterium]|nr:M1 family metallopeptidase [Acidobacteriota bacterium]